MTTLNVGFMGEISAVKYHHIISVSVKCFKCYLF